MLKDANTNQRGQAFMEMSSLKFEEKLYAYKVFAVCKNRTLLIVQVVAVEARM